MKENYKSDERSSWNKKIPRLLKVSDFSKCHCPWPVTLLLFWLLHWSWNTYILPSYRNIGLGSKKTNVFRRIHIVNPTSFKLTPKNWLKQKYSNITTCPKHECTEMHINLLLYTLTCRCRPWTFSWRRLIYPKQKAKNEPQELWISTRRQKSQLLPYRWSRWRCSCKSRYNITKLGFKNKLSKNQIKFKT